MRRSQDNDGPIDNERCWKADDGDGDYANASIVGGEATATTSDEADEKRASSVDDEDEALEIADASPAAAAPAASDPSPVASPAPAKRNRMPAKFRSRKPSDMPK